MKKIKTLLICMLVITTIFSVIGTAHQIPDKAGPTLGIETMWPMFRSDLSHSGFSRSKAPETNTVIWEQTVASHHLADSPPSVSNGKVYIGTWEHLQYGIDGFVYCFDAETGEEVWSYQTNGWIPGCPAISAGRVYFGSKNGNFYCLNAETGEELWIKHIGAYIRSSPAIYKNNVYFGAVDNTIYCLNAKTGDITWSFLTGGMIISSPAIVNGKVYIGSSDGTLYCLQAEEGTLLWNYFTQQGYRIESSPTVYEDKVYFGIIEISFGQHDGMIYCLDAETGEEIWMYSTGSNLYSSPAVYKNTVYIASANGILYCFNANTGSILWTSDFGGNTCSSPSIADGKVFITNTLVNNGERKFDVRGVLFCFDAKTGDEIWKHGEKGQMGHSAPAIANGIVYVGNGNGKVIAFSDLEFS